MTLNGAGFCSQSCPCGGAGQCVQVQTGGLTGQLCVVPGTGSLGARCLGPSDCASLLCVPSITGYGFCSRGCKGKAECGAVAGFSCAPNGVCEKPGILPAGWPCESGFDCKTGLCASAPGGKFAKVCTQVCEFAGDCPAGTGCTPLGSNKLCLPYGQGVEGSACLTPGACASKLVCDVGLLPGVGACHVGCGPFGDDLDCPSGQRCIWRQDNAAGACRVSADGVLPGQECAVDQRCRADLVCAGPEGKAPTCRPDCELASGAGCAPGQTCASIGDVARGVCADDNKPLQAVLAHPTPIDNFAAVTVNLPDVVPAAAFRPAPVPADDGCGAGRSQSVSPVLAMLALALWGLTQRKRRPPCRGDSGQ